MPNPTSKRVHADKPLTNLSIMFQQENKGFIHDKVFPRIKVKHQGDKYWTYDPAAFNRDEMQKRAPGTETAGVGFNLSDDNYFCENYGLHSDATDEEVDNADAEFSVMADHTELVTNKAMLSRENKWHDQYFKQGIWAADVDVTGSADFGSVPISDPTSQFIEGMRIEIRKQRLLAHGVVPNTLILTSDVWDVIKDADYFLNRVIGGATVSQAAEVSLTLLAQILEIPKILVSQAIQNVAPEGQPATNEFFATNGALLCHVNPRPGSKRVSAGYTFEWTRKSKGAMAGTSIRKFYLESIQATRIEVEQNFDNKVVAPVCGTFLYNLL